MANTVIKIENLSKQYRLGLVGTNTLHGDVKHWWAKMRGREKELLTIGDENKLDDINGEYVWALRDINLEVKQGEVLGIIGKNGAGKSTLLKILSRVTGPTTGSISVKGRIASLLEVGTGFHGELTGRENIFLNGAILGMKRHEIVRKFDEIVDFAGVAKYVDTPVKRYSSGMYVRLAFAVAAFLEPEILVVDEVLAVGDVEFQKKAIGKMQDVSHNEGRTVLFVSHNMQSIATLTDSCILMKKGQVSFVGNTPTAINHYLAKETNNSLTYSKPASKKQPSVTRVEIKTTHTNNVHVSGEPLILEFDLHTPFPLKGASFSFQIIGQNEQPIIHLWTFDSERAMCREKGKYTLYCTIPKSRLYMGEYTINTYFSGPPNTERFEMLEGVCPFKVEMFKTIREFSFRAGACTYLEDANWKIETNDI